MNNWTHIQCTAFEGSRRIASGALHEVALVAKRAVDRAAHSATPALVLIFNDATSEVIELDWRGSKEAFKARLDVMLGLGAIAAGRDSCTQAQGAQTELPAADGLVAARGPGRPKLGVVAREVTLLPRHWEWLSGQSGGASVALRKLVDAARRASEVQDRMRHASAVGYKFMSTLAGHEPGFEEASRALFAGDKVRFEAQIASWPIDVQMHLKKILADAFVPSDANAN